MSSFKIFYKTPSRQKEMFCSFNGILSYLLHTENKKAEEICTLDGDAKHDITLLPDTSYITLLFLPDTSYIQDVEKFCQVLRKKVRIKKSESMYR